MKNKSFTGTAAGVLVGSSLSSFYSFMHQAAYPTKPQSLIGQAMAQHQVHGALVSLFLLYDHLVSYQCSLALVVVLQP